MAEYAPDQNFKHPVCRGSWALGNNCKVCERCQATHPSRAGTQLLTNPNHTDTSRSGDLVELLRSVDISWSETGEWCAEAADRIEALSLANQELRSENEMLRGALGDLIEAVQRRTADLGGYDGRFGLNKSIVKARAALGEKS